MTCHREVITFRKVKCVKLHDAVMELMVIQGRDTSPSLDISHIMSSLSAQSTCLVNGGIPLSPISKSSVVSSVLLWDLKTLKTIGNTAFFFLSSEEQQVCIVIHDLNGKHFPTSIVEK